MRQLLIFILVFLISPLSNNLFAQSIADKVTIRRTDYGVPHIMANDFKSVAFGLAYAECEDRGEKVIISLIKARGTFARFNSKEDIDRDMYAKLAKSLTRNTYHLLSMDTRDVLDGFAEGVNYYLDKHPDQFPAWYYRKYNGIDVATVSNFSSLPSSRSVSDFLKALKMALDTLKIKYYTYKWPGEIYTGYDEAMLMYLWVAGSGSLGNSRVLYFNDEEDGKKSAVGGDGWVFAVEFGKKLKAYSILAYGQANDVANPHFAD